MARSKPGSGLPFEKPIAEALERLAKLRAKHEEGKHDLSEQIATAELDAQTVTREIFDSLTAIERVKLARHPDRPLVADYVKAMAVDVVELHGDRGCADDPAILTALCRIGTHRVMVIGHRKGADVKEKMVCRFGMPNPEGYRKAMLKMRLAERFGLPIVCLVDTPGAYPGIGAEERGQAWAIAENIQNMTGLRVPIVVAVVGEGGSGGALGIGIGDRVLVMENAYYSVITPEGCAAILWKNADAESTAEAATQLKLTAEHLLRIGIVDEIVSEPLGGAHRDRAVAAESLSASICRALDELTRVPTDVLLEHRYQKFRSIGRHLMETTTASVPGV